MKMNIKGFDVQVIDTKSGRKLLIEVGKRDSTELDKCIKEKFKVRKMIENDDKTIRCYMLKGDHI